MSSIGPPELLIVLLIVVLIFGGSKLPKLARSLGEAKNEFESAKADSKTDPKKDMKQAAVLEAAKVDPEDKITISKSELEALLVEREQKAKRD